MELKVRIKGMSFLLESASPGLLQELSQYSFAPDGIPLCVYGDSAYPLRVHLQGPLKGANLTPAEPQFNKAMSQVIVNYYCIPRFQEKLKNQLKSCCAFNKRSQLSSSIKYFEVYWNRSTPNPGLFQLGF